MDTSVRSAVPTAFALAAAAAFAVSSCSEGESASPASQEPAGRSSAKATLPAPEGKEMQRPPQEPAAAEGSQRRTPATGKVHECAGAGRWFPGEAEGLAKAVERYVQTQTPAIPQRPVALIVPHAGYRFSGPCAGPAYAALKGRDYERVILIGLSHRHPLRKASVLRVDAYETPLGRVPVDAEACEVLLACPVVTEQPACHRTEWSCENQLPFLQHVLDDFRMVELLVGDLSDAERAALAKVVRGLAGGETLLVVSSDFTHFGPNYGYVPFKTNVRQNLRMLNARAVHAICRADVAEWERHLARTGDTVCGRCGIGLLLKAIEPWGNVRAARVGFDTSGEITGDWTNSVTYTSIVMWRGTEGLTAAEKRTLLTLARQAVEHFLKTGERLRVDADREDLTPALKARRGAFVTLKNAGRLRGCIGHIAAIEPLYRSVLRNACNACRDPRFQDNPITAEEVADLTIEISVLSPSERLKDLDTIVIGRDGLILSRGRRRGVFLPQVPIEQGWDRTDYLLNLCRKAGLPAGAWREPGTLLHRFTAQVFREKENDAG